MDNAIGQTVTFIPEEMLIRIGDDDGLIIDLGRVTVADWLAIMVETDNEKRIVEMMKFNQKVLGDKYLSLPLVYMTYVNKRIIAAVARLFTEEGGGDADSGST